MSVVVKISGSAPSVFSVDDGLCFEDVCTFCCRDIGILPAVRHLFGLRSEKTGLWANPADLVASHHPEGSYELRLRFWPSAANLCKIGAVGLNFLYGQVCKDFVSGLITAFDRKELQSEALGLSVTAMYCHMQDNGLPKDRVNEVANNYKEFVPKVVRKNSNLSYSVESLKRNLRAVVSNPPGEVWFCKEQFLKVVARLASDYLTERYPVQVEDGENVVDYVLVIQPVSADQPGVKLLSTRKKIADQYVCNIDEICFVSVRTSDHRMEIARVNGVPQYFIVRDGDEAMKSCVSALNGYYRLMEKWTFDLCSDVATPSLAKLRSLKCHGPVGDAFAYEKMKTKRQNKQGTYILRESQLHYDELCLDVCLEEGEPATTFCITKCNDGSWTFTGLSCRSCDSVRDLLTACANGELDLDIPGLELKECLPPSENDVSQLLLCRQKTTSVQVPHETQLTIASHQSQLPVCIPTQSIQLFYAGVGLQYEFPGRFTVVHRGVWQRNRDEQVSIARKLLKAEFRPSHSQAFLESVQKCMFWRADCLVHVYGIILDANLSLIMEYLPLGPLDQYLQDSDLPVIDLVEACTNLAKALFYLEEKGYVHGNIRCRNLIVASHTTNSIRVKLSDSGVPCLTDDELPWIPIEFYPTLDVAHKRNASDIWACGTCMWEIFSGGTRPCSEMTKAQIVQAFIRGWRLPRPERCSGEVYHIMLATWSPDAYHRPKAQTIMRDINRILYEVYNSRRSNVYEVITSHRPRSLNGSLASGLTEATTLRAISENEDTLSYQSQFDDRRFNEANTSLSFFLSSIAINGSSLSMGDEGTSELATEIYELERNKLELGQLIGQGFYGEVRMGVIRHSDGTEETVAVKKLKVPSANNPESIDLQRECAIMKSLDHPNIVKIKAIVTVPSTMMVMEYVPMGSLLAYLRTQKEAIDNQRLMKFAADIAEGMVYLGENNIVHRDLAARNILVAEEDLVKISDFGLARQVDYNGYYVVRQNCQKLPMPWYAPESLDYWKFSAQSDVWSYGVTLYEMFSRGEEPNFVSGDHNVLLAALKQGRRLPCPTLCPRLIYRELMQPCWVAEASQRPSFTAILGKLRCLEAQL